MRRNKRRGPWPEKGAGPNHPDRVMSERIERPPLLPAAAAGLVLLTAQTFVLHSLIGRATSLIDAALRAAPTIAAWVVACWAGLLVVERWKREAIGRTRAAVRVVALGVALAAVAGTIRPALDPLLPAAVRIQAEFIDIWPGFLARWSGPGVLNSIVLWLASRRPAAEPAELAEPTAAPAPAFIERLQVRVGERVQTLALDGVSWIEADGNYVMLHAGSRRLPARITMAEVEAGLDPARFVRVHRSVIVATAAVREIHAPRERSATVLLADGTIVPLSRRGKALLRERLGRRA